MSMPFVGDLVDAGTDLIKCYFPPDMSEEERAKAERELEQMRAQARERAMKFQAEMEQELTERHKADMNSDSWMSKNIRPMVLVYLMVAWTVFAGFSLYEQSVDTAYVDMLRQMLMAAFGFYFTSRGLEKITSIVRGRGNGNGAKG